jgi:hypothetical protein
VTDVIVPLTGWGRGSWDSFAWGEGSVTNAGGVSETGSVSTTADSNVAITGVSGSGVVGSGTIVAAAADVLVAGASGTSAVGSVVVFVWVEIIPSQTPNYLKIDGVQSPSWAEILP